MYTGNSNGDATVSYDNGENSTTIEFDNYDPDAFEFIKLFDENSEFTVDGNILYSNVDGETTPVDGVFVTNENGDEISFNYSTDSNDLGTVTMNIKTGDILTMSDKLISKLSEQQKKTVGDIIWPTSGGYIALPFGARELSFHTGIDYATAYGTDVLAVKDGEVTFSKYHSSYGNLVKIDHGDGLETWYAHNSNLTVSQGDTVQAGDVIAKVGSTGRSNGNHLHFEVLIDGESINPMTVLPE